MPKKKIKQFFVKLLDFYFVAGLRIELRTS